MKQDEPVESILNKFKKQELEKSSSVQIIEPVELIETKPESKIESKIELKIEPIIELESDSKENLKPETLVLVVKPENTPSPSRAQRRRPTRSEKNKRVQDYKNKYSSKPKPFKINFQSPDSIHTHTTDKSKKDIFRKAKNMKINKNEISPSCETAELPISTNSSPKMSSPNARNKKKSYRNM